MTSKNGPVRRIVPGVKDDSGAFVPESKDLSIDGLMLSGLEAIYGVMRSCLAEAKTGCPSRESVMNLKDCMSMLSNLKEREAEVLEKLSDEELKRLADE